MSDVVDEVVDAVVAVAPDLRAALADHRGAKGGTNPSGDEQSLADRKLDDLLYEALTRIDGVGEFASEERESVRDCGDGLSVAIDPLDGSSNVESNNSMGTIVGVYDEPLPASGRDLVAAAYVLFGPITTMMVARDGEVTEYVVEGDADSEPGDDVRRTVGEDVALPEDPVVYGFGGRVPDWTDGFTEYAREIESELKLRYGGAMIGDVNQVMTYGGVFAYPGLQSRPEGKLRLQFEGNPMAYIVESAGGRSSDGAQSLLDVEPTGLHQRVPVHLGNEDLVDRLEATLA